MSKGAKLGIIAGVGCLIVLILVGGVFGAYAMLFKAPPEKPQRQAGPNRKPDPKKPDSKKPSDDDDDSTGPRDDDVFSFVEPPKRTFYLTMDGKKMKCKKKSASIKLVGMDAGKKAMIISTKCKTSDDATGSLEIQISPDAVRKVNKGEKLILNDPGLTGDPMAIDVELEYRPKLSETALRKKIGKKGVFASSLGQKSQAGYEDRVEQVYGHVTFSSFGLQPGAEIAGVLQLQAMPLASKSGQKPIAKTYWRFKGVIPADNPSPAPGQ